MTQVEAASSPARAIARCGFFAVVQAASLITGLHVVDGVAWKMGAVSWITAGSAAHEKRHRAARTTISSTPRTRARRGPVIRSRSHPTPGTRSAAPMLERAALDGRCLDRNCTSNDCEQLNEDPPVRASKSIAPGLADEGGEQA